MSYVILCHLKPAVGSTQLLSVVRKYAQLALNNGAIVRNIRNNGVRELAYSLRQKGDPNAYKSSHAFTLEVFAEPAAIAKLNGDLRLDDRVLRFTTLKSKGTLPRIPRPLRDAVARGDLVSPQVPSA